MLRAVILSLFGGGTQFSAEWMDGTILVKSVVNVLFQFLRLNRLISLAQLVSSSPALPMVAEKHKITADDSEHMSESHF